jgi:hypothetical protein
MSAHNPKHTSDRMCGDLVAARSKQWRRYFTDVHITGNLNLRPPVTRERSQVQSLIAPTFPRDFAASAGLSSWTSARPVIKAFEYDKSPHSRGGSMRDIMRSSRANQSIPGGVAAIRSMPDIKRSSTGNHRLPGGHRWHRPSCLTLNTSRGNQRKPGGPANNCQWAHAVSQHPLKIVA